MKLALLFVLLILTPNIYAWQADTHKSIIEYVYLNLPLETQQQLNITQLKQGSITPDFSFKDFRRHHYPASFIEAEKWLNNDTDLSLNLGIASHYISDSFVSPHNIQYEDSNNHNFFEKQVNTYSPNIKCNSSLTLNDLAKAVENKKDWDIWLKTKNVSIPRSEVDQAAQLILSITLNKLNSTCINKTSFSKVPYFSKEKVIAIIALILVTLYFLKH